MAEDTQQLSSRLLVARYLKTNGYPETFEAFIREAGLSDEAGDAGPGDLMIDQLLDEKRIFDKSLSFEKLSISDDTDRGWRKNAPYSSTKVSSLPSAANVLSIVAGGGPEGKKHFIFASSTDRRIVAITPSDLSIVKDFAATYEAPVLSQLIHRGVHHIATTMSGELIITDLQSGIVLCKRRDHLKYVVSIANWDDDDHSYLATAGWDNKVIIYRLSTVDGTMVLNEALSIIELTTKPEAILFVRHQVSNRLILIVTRTDSSHLHFYSVGENAQLLGKQNLAPYSNTWIAFTPSSIAPHPTNPGIIAVATNSTPHMKLLIVRLLLPTTDETVLDTPTQRERARAEQVVADREQNAIQLHCNTMSPQTLYSTPLVVWRPHGSGVWVNSDDGLIRGIDTVSGKIVAKLKAHQEGSKVRSLWSGNLSNVEEDAVEEECLISGGFDHNLFVWRTVDTKFSKTTS